MKLFFKTSGTELWTEKKSENIYNMLHSAFEEAFWIVSSLS